MTGRDESHQGPGEGRKDAPKAAAGRGGREARLAEQLRANLRRRKQQARQRLAAGEAGTRCGRDDDA